MVHNTSSTGLMVKWRPVPEGYVHGVLQGYRIRFQVQGVSSWSNLTTTNQSLELQALEKFTVYSIQVLAFTAIGDGNVSKPVWVSTDEDGNYEDRAFNRSLSVSLSFVFSFCLYLPVRQSVCSVNLCVCVFYFSLPVRSSA